MGCGVRPLNGAKFCQECGAETSENQEVCVKCGVRLLSLKTPTGQITKTDFSGLHPYYQEEFRKIMDGEETYKGRWNWTAFLLGPLWGFAKGLWLPSLIALVGGILTEGVVSIGYWFVFGIRGTYLYYSAYVKGKQLPA